MKSLKRLCADVCYENGYDPLLWPCDVWEDTRKEKVRKIIEFNENENNSDDWVGWLEGINSVNQQKHYVQSNMTTWYKFKSPKHVIGCCKIIKEQLLFYNPGIESFLGS